MRTLTVRRGRGKVTLKIRLKCLAEKVKLGDLLTKKCFRKVYILHLENKKKHHSKFKNHIKDLYKNAQGKLIYYTPTKK